MKKQVPYNHPIHEPTPASGRLLARVIGTR